MKIEEVSQKKAELEAKLTVIDNHLARAGLQGYTTMSVDGYYPVSITVEEADIILSAKRATCQAELNKVTQALDAAESLAKSMLTDGGQNEQGA